MGSPFQLRISLVALSTIWMVAGTGVLAQVGNQASMLHPVDALTYGTSPANIHLLIDHAISDKVSDLTLEYGLTDEQRVKLKLAARLEARQFFFAAEQLQRDYDASADEDRKKHLIGEAQSLNRQRRKLFGQDSFLAKVTARTVDEEQRLKHEEFMNERIRLRHRSNIEGAVRVVERSVVLQISQHEALVDLLLTKIPQPKSLSDFDETLVRFQFSQIPEQAIEPLFRADQWPEVRLVLDRFQTDEKVLKQNRIIPAAESPLPAANDG